jgi:hypothetical protein
VGYAIGNVRNRATLAAIIRCAGPPRW